MPPVAALGAAIGGAVSAGASAIGGAIAAGASAAGAAVGGLTLSGIATGASIVGAGLSIVGGITGNKTLQKVGMGFSAAGGIGFLANGMRGMSGVSSLSGSVDDALSAPLKGSKMVDRSAELWKAPGASTVAADKSAQLWGKDMLVGSQNLPKNTTVGQQATVGAQYDPGIEKNLFERAGNTWANYYPWMSMIGGMGEAYMMNQRMDLEKDLRNRGMDIEQAHLDRLIQNTQPMGLTLQPTTYARTPLLQVK